MDASSPGAEPRNARERARELAGRVAAPAVVAAAGITYARTACPYVLGGDVGELAAVGAAHGVAHPPGYPLYLLWLRAWGWLPAVSPAHRAALATAILGTLAVAALVWACRAWGVRREIAALAAGIFAFGPLMWQLSTQAEVFALNVLLALVVVGLAAPPSGTSSRGIETRRVALLGLVAGLGLSNHHSIVLLAPVGLAAAICAVRRAGPGRRALAAGAGLGALALGLLPYAYLVVVARSTPVGQGCIWGDPRDAHGLLRHFLRAEYGTLQLAISASTPDPVAQLGGLAERLFVDLLGAPLVALVGAVAWVKARPRVGSWWAYVPVVSLVVAFLLAGPVFVARFNLAPSGLSALVVERFYLLPLALASVLVALGIEAFVRRVPDAMQVAAGLVVVLLVAPAVIARALLSASGVREAHRPTTDLYVHNILRIVPKNAVVLGSGDDQVGAFLYQRCALSSRRDVAFVSPNLLLTAWYPRQVSAQLGFEIERGKAPPGADRPALDVAALLKQLLETGRPLFVTHWFARGLEGAVPSYPVGPLIRVVPTWKDVPPPGELLRLNEEALSRFDMEPTLPAAGTWAGTRIADYARPWQMLAEAFQAQGDAARVEHCRERAEALTPR